MRKVLMSLMSMFLVFAITASNGEDKKQKRKNNIKYKVKMADARHHFLTRNYQKSLDVYKAMAQEYASDAMVNYRIGQCYVGLKNYESAVEFFQTARNLNDEVDPELYLNLGRAYHRVLEFTKAKEAYTTFKSKAKKKVLKRSEVDRYEAQADLAEKMRLNPVDVKIKNIGTNINSKYDDYSPSFSADGRTMIFTSRRPDTKGGKMDNEGDYMYFEDIYLSNYSIEDAAWEEAAPIEGKINTDGHDASLSIAPDGEQIYIYRNDGDVYIGDIFVSKKKKSGKWGQPKDMGKPLNTSYFESSASQSSDGKFFYFVSERRNKKKLGGYRGMGDIYEVERKGKSSWGIPRNLGGSINSALDEISVFIHPNGKTLFFSSKGHKSMGGYDVFMSQKDEKGNWSEPVNLGYPINTVNDDVHFTLSTDGNTGYISGTRDDQVGGRDIYEIDLSGYDILKSGENSISILKGKIVAEGIEIIDAKIDILGEDGMIVTTINTEEDGSYFVTLPGNKKYVLNVSHDGFQPSKTEVFVSASKNETHTVEQDITLSK